MCDYCQSEGCVHGEKGADTTTLCGCDTVGIQTCPECGCDCRPWWADLSGPRMDELKDTLYETQGDRNLYPASKTTIVGLFANNADVADWLQLELPDRTFKDPDEVMISLARPSAPIAWQRQANELMWKYSLGFVIQGQQLVVGENQQAVLMTEKKETGDIFAEGSHTLSSASCPTLISRTRKTLPGYVNPLLAGSPLFLASNMEFEIEVLAMGQSRALRRTSATGSARVKLSSSGIREFVEQIASKSNYDTQTALALLEKKAEELVKKEMVMHELEAMINDHSLLEKPLSEGLANLGLEVKNLSFKAVGEFGKASMMPTPGMMGDPQKMEQMRQMMESMRAAQMAQLESMRPLMEQRQKMYAGAQQKQTTPQPSTASQTVPCPNCNSMNPQSGKFCNNCGKPLQVAKRTCPKCGQQLEASIKFCGNCGAKVE